MKRKLFLETFGCQMNQLDSELVLGQLRAQGYESVADREGADVIIYNTCSVREHAEQKVWSRLGELRERKTREPGLVIGVIGCMAERDGVNLFKKYPHVDLLCGPGELDKLAGMVHNASIAATAVSDGDALVDGQGARQVALMGATARRSSTLDAAVDHLELLDLSRSISPGEMPAQAYVRITRGCNKFCTYCVVPHTRGPEVHRPPANIIDEVKKLVASGVLEVTLLGQTVNHYAHVDESGHKTTFADLLYQVHEAVPDLPRLRFVTSFPRDFSDEALQAMRDCPRICRYLHIPAQSGSDRILRLMNRSYTAESYRALIQRAREMMPDICLASDFIVGFPTETDADFAQTVELLRECRFKNSFIFKYSPRPGTVAIDRNKDDVPEETKRRRNGELLEVQRQISQANNREMIGVRTRVLVESESRLATKPVYATAGNVELGWQRRPAAPAEETVQLIGRTPGDQIVAFDGNTELVGQLVDIEIVSARNLTLFGRILLPV
jgi:tRNA-2-methylthio-N6-dimethylallyladenosine synthase